MGVSCFIEDIRVFIGATVIMDKQYYKERILEILSDREAYTELTENEDKKIMKKINHLTNVYK